MERPEQRRISHGFLLFTFAPLVIFAALYETGRYEWAARSIAFDHCDIRLIEILGATAATLNIVIWLQWIIAALSIVLVLPRGRREVVAVFVVNALMLGVMHACVIPKLFGFAWTESVQSCGIRWAPYLKLGLSSVISCVTFCVSCTFAGAAIAISGGRK
jgi:hypothetical protein